MSLCINPTCPQPNHPQNGFNRYCEKCGSDLLLEKRYRVLRLLNNNSGFGDIYEAYETGSPKILKVLKQKHNNNAKAVELFQKEAEVLGELNHPGIPKVEGYYQNLTKTGLPVHCIVMEKIDGLNLEEWLQQQGNKSINQKLAIKLKELTAILHRHEKQFFHRDINPQKLPRHLPVLFAGVLLLPGLGVRELADYKYLPDKPSVLHKTNSSINFLANTLTGHSEGITSIVISPDGQTLVSGSWDNNIKIWNLKNGNLIRTLSGHSNVIDSIVISPDGQTLVSGSADRTIKIWNLKNGNLIRTLSGHSRSVNSVAISPDGQTLVSGSDDKTIKIWNLETGNLIRTLSGHSKVVWSLAISPDGQTLVSGSWDDTIKIWNLQNGNLIRTLSGHSLSVLSVAISPDGQNLVSGSADKTIKIWNMKNGNLIRTISGHSLSVRSVAISPDGQSLVSGSYDTNIKIWNLQTGNLIRTFSGHSDYVICVAISPDGQTLVSGSSDQTIKTWRVK